MSAGEKQDKAETLTFWIPEDRKSQSKINGVNKQRHLLSEERSTGNGSWRQTWQSSRGTLTSCKTEKK